MAIICCAAISMRPHTDLALVQTSVHEGFALPPLEAMATGAAVVCTDAHGDRDFCVDGVNCLMLEANAGVVCAAIARVLADQGLRARLGRAGIETAQEYAWERRIDALEGFFQHVTASRRMALGASSRPRARDRLRAENRSAHGPPCVPTLMRHHTVGNASRERSARTRHASRRSGIWPYTVYVYGHDVASNLGGRPC
jgi:Glycosyl transferases group 1